MEHKDFLFPPIRKESNLIAQNEPSSPSKDQSPNNKTESKIPTRKTQTKHGKSNKQQQQQQQQQQHLENKSTQITNSLETMEDNKNNNNNNNVHKDTHIQLQKGMRMLLRGKFNKKPRDLCFSQ